MNKINISNKKYFDCAEVLNFSASKVYRMSIASLCCLLISCSQVSNNYKLSDGHVKNIPNASSVKSIPKPISVSPVLPLPQPEVVESRHTVVASHVSVREILFALTRDANLNLDIDDDVVGLVTINAIDQPLSAILDRIARSTNLRYEKINDVVRVQRDTPFLKNYHIDYLNMSRSSSARVSVSTELGSTGRGGGSEGGGNSSSSNSSQTDVSSSSTNNFWETLENNIAAIIKQGRAASTQVQDSSSSSDGGLIGQVASLTSSQSSDEGNNNASVDNGAQSSNANDSIIINKEAGIMGVHATQQQHVKINQFLNQILSSAQRQVLIEATIAEVTLSDSYQAGIDWELLQNNGNFTAAGAQLVTDTTIGGLNFTLSDIEVGGDQLSLTLRALEKFGDVSIVSSPKVMALNNQTALLKVVDNLVYFTVDVDIQPGEDGGDSITIFESEVNTIPVGFVMTVTPFINAEDVVTLNVRPTISRVVGEAIDPNPAFADTGVVNRIPVVQVREIDSVLKVNSGDVAVIGGLMQDEISQGKDSLPVLGNVPFIGSLFRYDNDKSTKTELVIFLKPVVVKHASINSDLLPYKKYLPGVQ